MRFGQDNSNLLHRFQTTPGFARCGIKAEPIGRRNIRVSKAGRMLGIWREAIGSYQWVPAGQTNPQASVLTIDEAVTYMNRSYGLGDGLAATYGLGARGH